MCLPLSLSQINSDLSNVNRNEDLTMFCRNGTAQDSGIICCSFMEVTYGVLDRCVRGHSVLLAAQRLNKPEEHRLL